MAAVLWALEAVAIGCLLAWRFAGLRELRPRWAAALLLFGCVGGLVTLAKGRYGWFLVGLLTGGVLWNLTAILIAAPNSLWARHLYGPHKIARARRQFPTRPASPS